MSAGTWLSNWNRRSRTTGHSREDEPSREDGYTVLESVVAVALLTAVLVPAIGGLAHVTTTETAREDVVALSQAQTAMERALHERRFEPRTWTSDDDRWTLQRTVERDEPLVTVTVHVWRTRSAPGRQEEAGAWLDRQTTERPDRPPIVTLTTSRLLP